MIDIFQYWAAIRPEENTHPKDRYVLERMSHGFQLNCLPTCYSGRLRTAKVVLLYLSPGFDQLDVHEATTATARQRYVETRAGHRSLWSREEHEPGWRWWTQRTKVFGSPEDIKDKIALLNISPYHSKYFSDEHVLAALPSCRVTLDWAQQVLFPQAERGEKVVVCMRSARFWGLGKQQRYGESLFAPAVTRGGHMVGAGEAPIRGDVVAAVTAKLAAES